jgi:hypothetical protein
MLINLSRSSGVGFSLLMVWKNVAGNLIPFHQNIFWNDPSIKIAMSRNTETIASRDKVLRKIKFVNSFFLNFSFFIHNIRHLAMGRRKMNQ